MDNTAQMLIVVLGVFAIGAAYYAYKASKREQTNLREKKPTPRKNIKLYTQDGTLIESFDEVYMVRRDTNIYFIYEEEDGKPIARIDKGENMLLTATNVVTEE